MLYPAVIRYVQLDNQHISSDSINDLRVPPDNRLEKLSGDRAGQYSVRVNDQWRVCFTWSASGASNVELVDYH